MGLVPFNVYDLGITLNLEQACFACCYPFSVFELVPEAVWVQVHLQREISRTEDLGMLVPQARRLMDNLGSRRTALLTIATFSACRGLFLRFETTCALPCVCQAQPCSLTLAEMPVEPKLDNPYPSGNIPGHSVEPLQGRILSKHALLPRFIVVLSQWEPYQTPWRAFNPHTPVSPCDPESSPKVFGTILSTLAVATTVRLKLVNL